ncbi:MAG: DedA family protein [Chlamydiae bacterium]|nr:DedA family protein [Chlamydiota bacterium]
MFNAIKDFIVAHESHAPWVIFLSIALAGLNIPVSIDLMIILVAVLAATHLAHMKVVLFFSFFFGCCASAWISYTLGRTVGLKILNKVFSQAKLEKIQSFIKRYGTISLFIGRFIPFGFRNCLFMTTGFSKFPFLKFALVDAIACFSWTTIFFSLFYSLGQSFEELQHHLKVINISIAAIFVITIIGFFCYKYKKRASIE